MFKKVGFILCLVLFFSAGFLEAQEKAAAAKVKVAVLPFENTTADYLDTNSLAEMLQAELVGKPQFIVVERERMDTVMEEKSLALSGIISENEAVEIGEMLGAETIITGTVSFWEDKYVLTVKNIRVDTGEVMFADTVQAWNVSGIAEVMPQLARRLVNLAEGKKVAAFKLKPRPKTPEEREAEAAGKIFIFRENIFNNPNRQKYYVAFGPGIAIGSALGFPKSVMAGVMGRFKAPGETFIQGGIDLQVDFGKISENAGITQVYGLPFVAINLFNNGFIALTPYTGFFLGWNLIKESGDILNTPAFSFTQGGWHIGIEGGIYLGPKTILKLNWKVGIPFSYKSGTDLSTIPSASQANMAIPLLAEHNGIPLQAVNVFLELLR